MYIKHFHVKKKISCLRRGRKYKIKILKTNVNLPLIIMILPIALFKVLS